MTQQADQHRSYAANFSRLVDGVADGDWDNASPVADWVARDVVRHLVEWLPALLAAGSSVVLTAGPSVDDDPVAAWRAHAYGVQALLEDPQLADSIISNPHFGEMSVGSAIGSFYTPDVFMHAWDLAEATGQPHGLDHDIAAEMVTGMEPMDEMLRSSGQYGPRQPVAADADPVTRLMAFVGRDPRWNA